MLAISNKGDIKVSFKKDINFNEYTNLKKRKTGRNLKLQTTLSFKYLVSEDSASRQEVKHLFDRQMFSQKSFSEVSVAASKIQKVYRSYRIRRKLADCAVICEELWWKASVAASKIQKVYRSYRIRRKLADCAVICEELWWKAKDFTALNGGCLTSETTKVVKGLSKNDKTQKLALRHWLEAIDPRHRYGHNLHFYYDVWFSSQSSQPFFYWLDIGDGKIVNLEICSRKQLQRQCIKYLGPEEREAYEVIVEGGRLVYRQSKNPVHTTEGSKWIFVLSTSRILYVAEKKKGQFQHSSFLAGGATIASGRMVVHNGVLHVIWPYSGHYRPTVKNFMEFICFLEEHNVDMTNVKKHPVDDDVPPPKPVDEDLPYDCKEGNGVSSDSSTANNHGQENVGHFGANVEPSLKEKKKPLSSKWATGVGPRLGCAGEYPKKIQLQALKQLNLLPKDSHGTSKFSPKTPPIPSPRPSPRFHVSPRLVNLGLPSPKIHDFPF